MLGGHMDSWHSGTGATDNAAGVAVAMEAARIIEALDLKPRRTIRVALWTRRGAGAARLARLRRGALRPVESDTPSAASVGDLRAETSPAGWRPSRNTRSSAAYFNLDNGTGKIRGVYMEGNEAVRPIFRRWLAAVRRPWRRDADRVAHRRDRPHVVRRHRPARLPVHPGPGRVQHAHPPLEQDVYDRIQADDLKQASVIMADVRLQRRHGRREVPPQAARRPRPRRPRRPTRRPPPASDDRRIDTCRREQARAGRPSSGMMLK